MLRPAEEGQLGRQFSKANLRGRNKRLPYFYKMSLMVANTKIYGTKERTEFTATRTGNAGQGKERPGVVNRSEDDSIRHTGQNRRVLQESPKM